MPQLYKGKSAKQEPEQSTPVAPHDLKNFVGVTFPDEEHANVVVPVFAKGIVPEQILLAGQYLITLGQHILNSEWTRQEMIQARKQMQDEAHLSAIINDVARTKR